MSKRTLQRKLTSEAESFQSVLQSVRAELADHYLESSKMSLGEIAFLIGFRESNSFIRAYSTWKGRRLDITENNVNNISSDSWADSLVTTTSQTYGSLGSCQFT